MDCFEKYLALLKINTIEKPTYSFLEKIHLAHIETIAYSNLDFVLNRTVTFDIESIIEKFTSMHPSGICYELSYAFSKLLQFLGFDVKLVYANLPRIRDIVFKESETAHVVGLAKIKDSTYLLDVGFSNWFRSPINIEMGEQQDISGNYRITKKNLSSNYFSLDTLKKENYVSQYSFCLSNNFIVPHSMNRNLCPPEIYPNLCGDFIYSLPTQTGCKNIINTTFFTQTHLNYTHKINMKNYNILTQTLIKEMHVNEKFLKQYEKIILETFFNTDNSDSS